MSREERMLASVEDRGGSWQPTPALLLFVSLLSSFLLPGLRSEHEGVIEPGYKLLEMSVWSFSQISADQPQYLAAGVLSLCNIAALTAAMTLLLRVPAGRLLTSALLLLGSASIAPLVVSRGHNLLLGYYVWTASVLALTVLAARRAFRSAPRSDA